MRVSGGKGLISYLFIYLFLMRQGLTIGKCFSSIISCTPHKLELWGVDLFTYFPLSYK